MKVLICDDDLNFLQEISGLVRKFSDKTRLNWQITAVGTEAELQTLDYAGFDMALLDIDMVGMSGLDVAYEIRKWRQDTIIIFVTNYVEYAPEGYEVQAFRYLLKLELKKKLESYLQEAIEWYNKQHQAISFQINGEEFSVPVKKILYIEAYRRTMIMHLLEEQAIYQFYSTMAELEQKLNSAGFLRIHKSYLVNMEYIQQMQAGRVELSDGTVLSVSRKNYAEIKENFLMWRGEHRWVI